MKQLFSEDTITYPSARVRQDNHHSQNSNRCGIRFRISLPEKSLHCMKLRHICSTDENKMMHYFKFQYKISQLSTIYQLSFQFSPISYHFSTYRQLKYYLVPSWCGAVMYKKVRILYFLFLFFFDLMRILYFMSQTYFMDVIFEFVKGKINIYVTILGKPEFFPKFSNVMERRG